MADQPNPRFILFKLVVADIAAATTFYQSLFGFSERRRIEGPDFFEVLLDQGPGGFTLVLYQHRDGRPIELGNAYGPLGFVVQDIAAEITRAVSAGARLINGPVTFDGLKLAFLTDADGHEIELIEVPA